MNLDDIKSNKKLICLDCGDEITIENYSGWESFVSGRITQPLCKFCDLVRGSIGEIPKEKE